MLMTPPYHCGVLESSGVWMPLGLVYIAGELRKKEFPVEIYDAMSKLHDYEEIRSKLKEAKPDVVAIGAYTATFYEAVKVLKLAKELNPAVITILGGLHVTFCWEEALKEHGEVIDYIVRGEGEIGTAELLSALEDKRDLSMIKGLAYRQDGEIITTGSAPFIADLDSLSPAWDLVEWPDYTFYTTKGSRMALVSSSRGCTEGCSFCSQQLFWARSWRARDPVKFVEEVEFLVREHEINVFMITDEYPTCDRDRWEKILDLLIEKSLGIEILMETRVDDILRDEDIIWKYKKAGVLHIYVGVEATSQETLDRFKKNIKVEESKKAIDILNEADIISETSLVLGLPEETPESIRRTLKLAQYYNPDMCFFLALAPWPYADIYAELEPYIEEKDYSKYNLVCPIVKPVNMTIDQFNQELINCFKEFYMGKMRQLSQMTPMKREYLIKVVQLIMANSYLTDVLKKSMKEGGMPQVFQDLVGKKSKATGTTG